MTHRTERLRRAVTTLAAGIVAVAGCSADHAESSTPPFGSDSVVPVAASVDGAPPPSVAAQGITVDHLAMVGDSITVGAEQELTASLAELEIDDVEIDAEGGRRMVEGSVSSGVDGVDGILAEGEQPDLWVIALGTNDVANYEPGEYADVIEQVLAAVPAGAPVVWVDSYLDDYQTASAAFDDVLRQVLTARGNASVVDWASIASEDGVLSDGIHPSGFGRQAFADRVATAVEEWMD